MTHHKELGAACGRNQTVRILNRRKQSKRRRCFFSVDDLLVELDGHVEHVRAAWCDRAIQIGGVAFACEA
jgi:hypothetical protein